MATKRNTAIKNGEKTYEYYRLTKTIGHEYKNGKKVPIRKQFLGRSKREAELKYENWKIEQALLSEQVVDSNRPLGELVAFWQDNVFGVSIDYATGTKERYTRAYRQFTGLDHTGLLAKPIQSVSANDIQIAYNNMDVNLSTVQALHKFFRLFFGWAAANRYCTDVMGTVVIPKKTYEKHSEDIIVRSENEIADILAASEGSRLRLLIVLSLYGGLRIGEALGVRYSDFDGDVLHVRRQYTREGEYAKPKYNSGRDIPLHDVVLKELEIHKKWHLKEARAYVVKSDQVFTTSLGTSYDHANVRHQLSRLYKRNGIEDKKFHAYRATFCTNLCKAGVPIQVASSLMGHKSVDVTSRFYTFVSEQEKFEAIKKL